MTLFGMTDKQKLKHILTSETRTFCFNKIKSLLAETCLSCLFLMSTVSKN